MAERPASDVVRVIVADDHAVVRTGMRAFFDMVDDIAVVGEARNGADALELLARMAAAGDLPHVVLMDLVMPHLDGIAATIEVTRRYPAVRVIALTYFGQSERVHTALEAGAVGFLLKDAEADEVAAAVRAAHRDEVYLDAAVARQLTQLVGVHRSGVSSLTAREREVLRLLAQGKSNRQIAQVLVVSERTARTHVSHVLGKLGLSSRTQAALWAVREGLASLS